MNQQQQQQPLFFGNPVQINPNDPKSAFAFYAIKGRPVFSYVDVVLQPGQQVQADAGTMFWMDGAIQMNTWCIGSGCNPCLRTCSGETFCMNTFINPLPTPATVTFGITRPGDILPFCVTPGNGWVLTKKSFIAGSENCEISCRWAGCGACTCVGEGPFISKVNCKENTTMAMFFAGNYGMLERVDVAANKTIVVGSGMFFAAHEAALLDIGIVGGCKGLCFSGEGVILRFRGPCVIYTKSRDYQRFLKHASINIDEIIRILMELVKVITKAIENARG